MNVESHVAHVKDFFLGILSSQLRATPSLRKEKGTV
jgi:hypothetical protein